LHFDESGECSACRAYKARPEIDWDSRKQELLNLLEKHQGRCIVPCSGGKDSHYQVLTLLGLGADVTVITASTCHLTAIGRANIDNLAKFATTIEVTPNRRIRSKLNRLGLELVGDISWPEHASIFSVPFRMAKALGINLIFYGESPQREYGGPPGSEDNRKMDRRWTMEFGGFLGLRPSDFVGLEGITESDMQSYQFPRDIGNVEAHFLGQYIPWDSHQNAKIAREAGMKQSLPSLANWWAHENLDNWQTLIHDHACYRKFGYGRLAAQLSVDIRYGLIDRAEALDIVADRDGLLTGYYSGVLMKEGLSAIGLTRDELISILDRFTNWDLFSRVENGRPLLKEFDGPGKKSYSHAAL
jgi:hypothetical protein